MPNETMVSWSKENLRDLVAYFEESLSWEFDLDELSDRIKLQKLVYFAREFGLEVPYRYNIYRYGPYSPSLANDYFEMGGSGNPAKGASMLDADRFEEFVGDRDTRWLEIAATIHKIKPRFETRYNSDEVKGAVISRVSNMKRADRRRVEVIYDELEAPQ